MTPARDKTKTITKLGAATAASAAAHADGGEPVLPPQAKRQEPSQFRLLVDRQAKGSFETFEAAQAAGMIIKKGYPKLQVAVYDGKASTNTIIELPSA